MVEPFAFVPLKETVAAPSFADAVIVEGADAGAAVVKLAEDPEATEFPTLFVATTVYV